MYSDDWLNAPIAGGYTYTPDYVVKFDSLDKEEIKDFSYSEVTIQVFEESNNNLCYTIVSKGELKKEILEFENFHE